VEYSFPGQPPTILQTTGSWNALLYNHLVKNSILAKEQFGFRINLFTNYAAYRLLDQTLTAFNNGNYVGEYSVILKRLSTV
jgi:hypothetical protein